MSKFFKCIIYILLLTMCTTHTFGASANKMPMRVEEEDGDPTGRYRTLKFANGALTDNGDNSVSVAAGAGMADPFMRDPVEEYWDVSGGLPVDPDDGDRYIADGTGGGWTDGYIYEWDEDEGEWIEEIPVEGWMVWMLFELVFWVFFSGGWMEVGDGTYVRLDGEDTNITNGTFDMTTTGTVTAEQLTSTDDATVTDDLNIGDDTNITTTGRIYFDAA